MIGSSMAAMPGLAYSMNAILTGEIGQVAASLYFSFTALTTDGFGGATVATDQARSFAIIEEFAGVLFVGIRSDVKTPMACRNGR